jgi:uncharacterized protein YegJ (DUF2314 family)
MKKIELPVKIFLIITSLFAFILLLAIFGQRPGHELDRIDPFDPLLIEAKQKAAATLNTFLTLYPQFPQNSFVRFKFVNDKNEETHVWGKVIRINENSVRVSEINKNSDLETSNYPAFYDLSKEQIEDWLVETGNDSVRGGFTTQVIMLRNLQNNPQWQDSLTKQLGLFLDELE